MLGTFNLTELQICAATDAPALGILEWPGHPLPAFTALSTNEQGICIFLSGENAFRLSKRPANVGIFTPCAGRLSIHIASPAIATPNAKVGSLAVFANGHHALIVTDVDGLGFREKRYLSLTDGRVLGDEQISSYAFESWKLIRKGADGSQIVILDRADQPA